MGTLPGTLTGSVSVDRRIIYLTPSSASYSTASRLTDFLRAFSRPLLRNLSPLVSVIFENMAIICDFRHIFFSGAKV